MEQYARADSQRNVAIVGAGLSGLCLAQALLRTGFDVHVYERDPSAQARRQGYRITIDAYGGVALKRCLPPSLFEAVRATASPARDVGYMRFTNEQLGEILKLTFRRDPGCEREQLLGQVDRSTLRTIMLSGLGERVHFGSEVVDLHTDKKGATIRLAGGTTAQSALVVGADGIHSVVREKVLPDCPLFDTGMCGIYGKTPLSRGGAGLVPQALDTSGLIALGGPGRFFFFTSMVFDHDPRRVFSPGAGSGAPAHG